MGAVNAEVNPNTSVTPSGDTIEFESEPKRLYRVNGVEVPSVTQVLDCLHKPALIWWGQGVGVQGTLDLIASGELGRAGKNPIVILEGAFAPATKDNVVPLLTKHKITVNHTRDAAGRRGSSVHAALEAWCVDGQYASPHAYPEEERGYVEGLNAFLADLNFRKGKPILSEVMVGSKEHGFAGRYDNSATLNTSKLVVSAKKGTRDEFKGSVLWDLKTSGKTYPTHQLQLAAYEGASVECGYPPTDHQLVVRVGSDGSYEVKKSGATLEDFLGIKAAYDVLRRVK